MTGEGSSYEGQATQADLGALYWNAASWLIVHGGFEASNDIGPIGWVGSAPLMPTPDNFPGCYSYCFSGHALRTELPTEASVLGILDQEDALFMQYQQPFFAQATLSPEYHPGNVIIGLVREGGTLEDPSYELLEISTNPTRRGWNCYRETPARSVPDNCTAPPPPSLSRSMSCSEFFALSIVIANETSF